MNAAKLKAIAAMLADYVPGDDEDADAEVMALVKAIVATKSPSGE